MNDKEKEKEFEKHLKDKEDNVQKFNDEIIKKE